MKTKVGKWKDNLFVVLPKEAVAKLGWDHGDILEVDAVDGVLNVVRTMTHHQRAMEIAERVMDEYRETFEALAKF